ncbi:beta-ketoacyl synthase N-terminal-like domain-containing protein, partial [Streptomyces hainanensis]|uniref:beta-ketoacyl synthase N-terminal-like domain-containing protein n=1 Tax=Streptomyces hainanensis TaxID=402648 RepID=UPI001FB6337D
MATRPRGCRALAGPARPAAPAKPGAGPAPSVGPGRSGGPGGPAYTVDAACASSLVAVDHAVRELATGRCDLMLAGGVHHCH